MLRRAISLTLLGLLAHVSAERAFASCGAEKQPVATASHQSTEHGEHASHHGDAPQAPAEHEDCSDEQPRECCQAVTSCGIGELSVDRVASGDVPDRDAGIAFTRVTPRSRVGAPEPPPPRA